jgi:hypothetical protein
LASRKTGAFTEGFDEPLFYVWGIQMNL